MSMVEQFAKSGVIVSLLLLIVSCGKGDKDQSNVPSVSLDDLKYAGQTVQDMFATAPQNSVGSVLDSAITADVRLIIVGEKHDGKRLHYTQLMDRYLDAQTDCVFLEIRTEEQPIIDDILAGRTGMLSLAGSQLGHDVIAHAKEKHIAVKAIDSSRDRDVRMARNIQHEMQERRIRRGLVIVGAPHIVPIPSDLPSELARLNFPKDQMVDVRFHDGSDTVDNLRGFAPPPSQNILYEIVGPMNLTKAILLGNNPTHQKLRHYYSPHQRGLISLKHPFTKTSVYAFVDYEKELPVISW